MAGLLSIYIHALLHLGKGKLLSVPTLTPQPRHFVLETSQTRHLLVLGMQGLIQRGGFWKVPTRSLLSI
jgi:hypothetical protein